VYDSYNNNNNKNNNNNNTIGLQYRTEPSNHTKTIKKHCESATMLISATTNDEIKTV